MRVLGLADSLLGGDRFLRHLGIAAGLGLAAAFRSAGAVLGLGDLGHFGARYADLLQVFLVGLGVVVDVLAGTAVGGDQQSVGLLQAADDLGQALALRLR